MSRYLADTTDIAVLNNLLIPFSNSVGNESAAGDDGLAGRSAIAIPGRV